MRLELEAFLNVVIFIPRGWMSGPLSNGRAKRRAGVATRAAGASPSDLSLEVSPAVSLADRE